MADENPPQITWEAILRQRMFDFLNVHSSSGGSAETERGEQVIEWAIEDLKPYLLENNLLANTNNHGNK